MNVNGWNVGSWEDVCKELNEWDIDLVGVSETQLRERIELDDEYYKMIGSGRSKCKKRGGGVGVIVRKGLNASVEEVKVGDCEMSEDLFAVRLSFKSRRKSESILIVVCYMTVQGRDAREENERKYELLNELMRKYNKEQVIVMGDMNGHIGILGEPMNENGERLLNFAERNDLEILNVTIAEGRVTWSRRQSESAIDYIMVNERARKHVLKMCVDEERKINIPSDHNMLWIKYVWSIESANGKSVKRDRGWRLRNVRWENFRESLEQVNWEQKGSVDEINEIFCKTVREIAEKKIGRVRANKSKRVKKSWWNEEIENARKERKACNRRCRRLRFNRDRSEEDRLEYEKAWEEYKRKINRVKALIRKAKGKVEKMIVDNLRAKGEEGGREWYRFLRGEEVRKNVCVDELKVGDKVVRGMTEKMNAVKDFWVGGVNEDEDRSDINLMIQRRINESMDEEISKEEIERYVRSLKNGKAAGIDEIPYEFYKEGGKGVIDGLYKTFLRVWREERVPRKWNESRVNLIHKGGHKSKSELKNYRPISLSDTISKVFCGIMNERLKKLCERCEVMGEEQNGFRKDRRGEDNMFVVREVIEKMNKRGTKV